MEDDTSTRKLFVCLFLDWCKTHCVLTSPRMVEVMGTDVLTYHNHTELKEGFRW